MGCEVVCVYGEESGREDAILGGACADMKRHSLYQSVGNSRSSGMCRGQCAYPSVYWKRWLALLYWRVSLSTLIGCLHRCYLTPGDVAYNKEKLIAPCWDHTMWVEHREALKITSQFEILPETEFWVRSLGTQMSRVLQVSHLCVNSAMMSLLLNDFNYNYIIIYLLYYIIILIIYIFIW